MSCREAVMKESIIQRRSFDFALEVIRICRALQEQREYVISKQLMRSGTSIGANVEEATAGQSRRDFLAKMAIACKEARETRYWIRLLQESKISNNDFSKPLQEIEEIIRILTSIVKTTSESL
jgi:four helix bundle protein